MPLNADKNVFCTAEKAMFTHRPTTSGKWAKPLVRYFQSQFSRSSTFPWPFPNNSSIPWLFSDLSLIPLLVQAFHTLCFTLDFASYCACAIAESFPLHVRLPHAGPGSESQSNCINDTTSFAATEVHQQAGLAGGVQHRAVALGGYLEVAALWPVQFVGWQWQVILAPPLKNHVPL